MYMKATWSPSMSLKHKEEWNGLVLLARKNHLTLDNTIFLLALRETEDGALGYEFGVNDVRGTNLKTQALWAIKSILKNETRWHKYIIEKKQIDFISFFAYHGGPYSFGWHSHDKNEWFDKMNFFITEIKKEMENGLSGIDYVGK